MMGRARDFIKKMNGSLVIYGIYISKRFQRHSLLILSWEMEGWYASG